MWLYVVISIALAIGVTAGVQHLAQRKHYRPLSSRQPERRTRDVPLGLEALDLDMVSRTNRRNESLERGRTNWLGAIGSFGRSDADITPLADDETYAARYHRAFQNPKSED